MNSGKVMTKDAHDQVQTQGCDTMPTKAAPKHCDRASVLHRAVFPGGSNRVHLSFAGIDRVGMIQHIAQCTAALRVNIVGGFTTRVLDRFSGSYLVAEGDKADLQELRRQLKIHKKEAVPGKQILAVKAYELSYQGPDKVGLLLGISKVLTEHDVNIVTMGGDTTVDEPEGDDVIENIEELGRVATIEMRIEVPREQVANVKRMEAKLKALEPKATIEVRENRKKSRGPKSLSLLKVSAN